jgi:tRNA A-37 threonylcarbamoyl transferase component Bud32
MGELCAYRPDRVDEIIGHVVAAIEGAEGRLYHQSLHAVTYQARIADGAGSGLELYIKTYHPPRGLLALKQRLRGGRADNVLRITRALRRADFGTPQVVLKGVSAQTGATMLASVCAEGQALADFIQDIAPGAPTDRKRMLIRALGREVARLHRAGFIHGDLTPYNVFVARAEPPHFILLDHDRTRHGFPVGRRYRQLRNLVQLGRFDFAGLSNTDRLRFFRAYAADMDRAGYRATLRRVARMLARRRSKDAG